MFDRHTARIAFTASRVPCSHTLPFTFTIIIVMLVRSLLLVVDTIAEHSTQVVGRVIHGSKSTTHCILLDQVET